MTILFLLYIKLCEHISTQTVSKCKRSNYKGIDFILNRDKLNIPVDMTIGENPTSRPVDWLEEILLYKTSANIYMCYHKLLPRSTFSKENSEIAAALFTSHKITMSKYENSRDNDSILWIFHGDGEIPHGSYAQSILGGKVLMLDPEYNEEKFTQKLESCNLSCPPNLECHKTKAEIFLNNYTPDKTIKLIMVIGIHSHANTNKIWTLLDNHNLPMIFICIPCCKNICHVPTLSSVQLVYDSFNQFNPSFRLGNSGILSTCNRILIYKNKLVRDDYLATYYYKKY